MTAPEQSPSRNLRLATWGVRLLAVVLVFWTCAPNLQSPQLEADDYRYLALVQQLESDPSAEMLPSMIVENRWDHLWWLDMQGKARFFRPTVLLSFWLDKWFWQSDDRADLFFGLVLTNTLVHLLCVLLVLQLLLWIFGHGYPAWLGGLLFAAFACHAEVLWYVSGRTDSMAVLGFLVALALHWRAFGGPVWMRWLAVPAFAFALLTKELTVALPLVALLGDQWLSAERSLVGFRGLVARLRGQLWLFVGYGLVVVGYLLVRWAALGEEGAGRIPYPYSVRSFGGEFVEHLGVQLGSYLGNLFAAYRTQPFLEAQAFDTPTVAWLMGLVVCVVLLLVFRRSPRFWWFAVLALVTWLPTCFVYVSERYLYLPSFALSGVVALALSRSQLQRQSWSSQAPGRQWGGVLLLTMVCAWIAHQAYTLHWKHSYFARTRNQTGLVRHFDSVRDAWRKERKPILVVNFPGDWADAQFLQYQMRFDFAAPKLQVRVLSLMPAFTFESFRASMFWHPVHIRRDGPRTIRLKTAGTLVDGGQRSFPSLQFDEPVRVERDVLGFVAESLDGEARNASQVRFELARDLRDYLVLRFQPPATKRLPGLSQGEFIDRCRLQVVR